MTVPTPSDLHAAEDRLQAAQLAGDVEALDELLADEVVFVGPDGTVADKQGDLDSHRSGLLQLQELRELARFSSQFENTGLTRVRLHLQGTVAARPLDEVVQYTRTWRFQSSAWRVIQAQGTLVPKESLER